MLALLTPLKGRTVLEKFGVEGIGERWKSGVNVKGRVSATGWRARRGGAQGGEGCRLDFWVLAYKGKAKEVTRQEGLSHRRKRSTVIDGTGGAVLH